MDRAARADSRILRTDVCLCHAIHCGQVPARLRRKPGSGNLARDTRSCADCPRWYIRRTSLPAVPGDFKRMGGGTRMASLDDDAPSRVANHALHVAASFYYALAWMLVGPAPMVEVEPCKVSADNWRSRRNRLDHSSAHDARCDVAYRIRRSRSSDAAAALETDLRASCYSVPLPRSNSALELEDHGELESHTTGASRSDVYAIRSARFRLRIPSTG